MMQKLIAFRRNIVKWLGKAWAVIIPISVIIVHLSVINNIFPDYNARINQFVGFLATLTGVGFMLYGMNEALSQFNAKGFRDIAVSWIAEMTHLWPAKPIVVSVSGVAQASASATGTATVVRDTKSMSLEQRLDEIELRVSDLQMSIGNVRADYNQKIEKLKSEIQERNELNEGIVDQLSKTLKDQAIGSISHEFFGAILAIYSLVVTTFFEMPVPTP